MYGSPQSIPSCVVGVRTTGVKTPAANVAVTSPRDEVTLTVVTVVTGPSGAFAEALQLSNGVSRRITKRACHLNGLGRARR